MCGRYTLNGEDTQLAERWLRRRSENAPYDTPVRDADVVVTGDNLCPSQWISVLVTRDKRFEFVPMRWGLIPSWANDESIGAKTINARAETITEKPAYRRSFRHKRGVVPASSFYEWRRTPSGVRSKDRFEFGLKSRETFFMAALWDSWCSPDGSEIESVSIITTTANTLVATIHDRMPAILTETAVTLWLTAKQDASVLSAMLAPSDPNEMIVTACTQNERQLELF